MIFALLLGGCVGSDLSSNFVKNPKKIVETQWLNLKSNIQLPRNDDSPRLIESPSLKLTELLDEPDMQIDFAKGFKHALKSAVEAHPEIVAFREDLSAKDKNIRIIESQKDLQLSGNLYGGLEDVSDNQKGLAVVLSAKRLLYDGGVIATKANAERLMVESMQYELAGKMETKARELTSVWLDLERYEKLNQKIESRLMVLNPLISQLEKVANAGLGDVSQVTAAQRTVSMIRVTQAEVRESLERARVDFINAFGSVPADVIFSGSFIDEYYPSEITKKMVHESPAIRADFAAYKSSEWALASVEAKDTLNVGFESRLSRPLGDSGYDSDEAVGLVVSKTFFHYKKLETERAQAKLKIKSRIANLKNTYRSGERSIKNAQQTIESMETAIALSRKNAEVTAAEIDYLRKQLVIGGSTLATVLAAEARLYEAEAQEINFIVQKRNAELIVMSALGLLGPALNLSAQLD